MRVWIAIWTGSTLICGRIGAWIAGGPVARVLAVVLAAGFIKGLPWTTYLVWTGAAGWLGTAIAIGLRPAPETSAEEQQEKAPARQPLTLDQLSAAMHEVGAPHAHLKAIAVACGTTPAAVREKLEAAGIPVSSGVRMSGKVSTGVDRRHFLPRSSPGNPPLEPPAVGVVVAGQSNNNNDDNALTVERQEGMSIIRDPADRKRRRTLLRR
ncbi:hypothetical protein [Streptomyces xantholiticus]|uniref:hypothetical protein n=1 Tax=Streptomyces xantholiticus TaxID=68285 RepID=UPI001677A6C9|nr:hypothetical protein [Streptomyces xantholiticus]GGW41236.1 hypothetical protein GCM10010381_27610 [Streptomyces xantholiticus]